MNVQMTVVGFGLVCANCHAESEGVWPKGWEPIVTSDGGKRVYSQLCPACSALGNLDADPTDAEVRRQW